MRTCDVLQSEAAHECESEEDRDHPPQAGHGALRVIVCAKSGNDVPVDADVEEVGPDKLHGRDAKVMDTAQPHPQAVRTQILQQPPREMRVVDLAKLLFFAEIAHSRASSSSSNCFW